MSTFHSQRNRTADQLPDSKFIDATHTNQSLPCSHCDCLEEDAGQTAFSISEMAMLMSRYKRAVYERFSVQINTQD